MTFDSKNESLRKFMVSHIRDDMNTHSNGFMMDYYTLLYKHYPDAIFTMDREGNLIDINDKTEEVIGYKPRDIIGSNFSHFLKKEHLPTIQEYFERALKGEPQNYLCEVLHKNGQIVHLSAQIIPIEWKHEIVGVFGFAKSQTELVQKELELTKVTNSLNLAQQVAKIGSWDYDIETDCLFCSESLKEILGFDNQQKVVINYENLLKMIYFQKDREYFDHHFQRIKHSGGKMDLEYKVKLLDDHMITLRVTAEAKKDKHGRISRIIGIANDITDQVLTKSKLKESEEKFEKIAQNIDVGLWSMDYTLNQIVYVSPAIEQIAGYHPEVFLTGEKTWEELIHPDDMENYRHHLNSLFHGEIVSQQYRIINAHAEVRWLEDKTFPIIGANGELIRLDGIVQDISERKEHEEKINFIANHDYLTKLYNRRMFDQKLEEFISKKDKFVLYYLDIDRFKFVNDTLGHEIGDGLLIAISERLSTLVGNDLVFRLGGDEFAIILTNIQEYDYLALGQEIIREIEKPFQIEGYDINISTSIGGNIFPDDGETLSELKSNADVALYRAKDLGKNNVQFFTKSLNSETYQLFNLENDLRNAIRNDEFSLYYQPKVDTFTGEMAGAEALIRWNHPERGLVSPGQFIPIAEETEIINEISDWVIETVCSQLKEWQDQGYSLVPISVNLSAKTLMKADLVDKIQKYLTKYSISRPSLIEIEITEESIIKSEGFGLSTIQQLRDMGHAIALDDFGTGFSSIGYLKRFQVDYLKIDRSFIMDIHKSDEDLTILKSIILLSKGFGLKVVAEGVEDERQWKLIKKLNCHYIQGFLFSKPLPVEAFSKRLHLL